MDNGQHEVPTEQQWRDLGSAEANAWIITPLGGPPMSLDEYAKYRENQEKERQEHLQIAREEMENEKREREAALPAATEQTTPNGEEGPAEPRPNLF